MDLALRKVARDKGHSASELLLDLGSGIPGMLAQAGLSDIAGQVSAAVQALEASTAWVVDHATKEAPAVQAVSVHYLELWGVVLAALLLARATAVDKNRANTARFFVQHRLVYAPALATIVQTGAHGILSGQLSPP
jgi:hypothetical protein